MKDNQDSIEDIHLSDDELDNIIADAELSEVNMDKGTSQDAKETPPPKDLLQADDETSQKATPGIPKNVDLEDIKEDFAAINDEKPQEDTKNETVESLDAPDIDDLLDDVDVSSDAASVPTDTLKTDPFQASETSEDHDMTIPTLDDDVTEDALSTEESVTPQAGEDTFMDDKGEEAMPLSSNEMDNILEDVHDTKETDLHDKALESETPLEDSTIKTSSEFVDEERFGEAYPPSTADSNMDMTFKQEKGTANTENSIILDKKELQDLLGYLDTILEHLPEDKIKSFAHSEYYDKYISLINQLGL